MVDTTSGANIISQMANKPTIALDDPVKAMQDVEDLRGKQLSNKKSALGLNMDQSNGIARAMLAASMDPNATPQSMAAEADRLGQLYGVDSRIIDSWKGQIQPGMTQPQLQQLGMRATSLALTPAEQFQAGQNSVKYQNIGGRLVAVTQNSPLNANPNQLSQAGGPDIKLTQPPDYANTGPEIVPRSEGVVTGPGIRLGTSPGVYGTGDTYEARPGQYGAGTVAPQGRVSEENDATPYTWKDTNGADVQGTRGQFRAAAGAGRAQPNSGQPAGGAQSGPGTYNSYRGGTGAGNPPPASSGGPLPGPNPITQKANEATILENRQFYRQQQDVARSNAQAIRQGEDALDALEQTNSGPGSEKIYDGWGVVNMLARQFGLPEVEKGNVQAYQELKKNLLAQARSSGAATASVGQLEASVGSNPNQKMDPTVIRRMEINLIGDMRNHNALVNSAAANPQYQDDFKNVYQRGMNTLQPLGAMPHRLTDKDKERLEKAIEADKTGRLRELYRQTLNMHRNHGSLGTVPGVTEIIQ